MSGSKKAQGGQEYENPPEESMGEEQSATFEEPSESEMSGGGEEMSGGTPEGVDAATLGAFEALDAQLAQRAASEQGGAAEAAAFEASGSIIGVGIGQAADAPAVSMAPGSPVLNVYVAEPMDAGAVRSILAESMGVSAARSEDFPMNVVVTGPIDAFAHRFVARPAPGGVSVGHRAITAGTLGCLARGLRAPRDRRLMVLSNNHVLANSNSAALGDAILQPGPYDGGTVANHRIAILENFVPIRFGSGQVNYVDAATGWAWPNLVRPELVYRHTSGSLVYFRVNSAPVACQVGMLVGKTGRTTQLTVGRIVDCNASLWVNYGGGRQAFFRSQIVIQGLSGSFSQGGDSGSLIWTWNSARNPVGLLFAGSSTHTIANRIQYVLAMLDIQLYT